MDESVTLPIEGIEAIPVSIPFDIDFDIAGGGHDVGTSVLVRLHTEDGPVGIGEAAPNPAFAGETQRGVAGALEILESALVGEDAARIGNVHRVMDEVLRDNPMAKSAVDIACHDALGKALDVPVSTLLGGRNRDRIETYVSIGIKETEKAVADAEDYVHEQGFRNIKVKVGGDPDDDEQRVRAIYEALHDDAAIQVDANQGYTTDVAVNVFSRLERDIDVMWFEQPVPRSDTRGMRTVTEALRTPVLADESVYNASDAFNVLYNDAADLIHLKLSKAKGYYGNSQTLAVATAAGSPVVTASNVQFGVGTTAGVQFASAVPELPYPCAHRGPLYFEDDVIAEPMRFEDGYVHVPDGPGLGIELDDETVEEYRGYADY